MSVHDINGCAHTGLSDLSDEDDASFDEDDGVIRPEPEPVITPTCGEEDADMSDSHTLAIGEDNINKSFDELLGND